MMRKPRKEVITIINRLRYSTEESILVAWVLDMAEHFLYVTKKGNCFILSDYGEWSEEDPRIYPTTYDRAKRFYNKAVDSEKPRDYCNYDIHRDYNILAGETYTDFEAVFPIEDA